MFRMITAVAVLLLFGAFTTAFTASAQVEQPATGPPATPTVTAASAIQIRFMSILLRLRKHDPEKACPALDAGWTPVFRLDHAQTKTEIRPASARFQGSH